MGLPNIFNTGRTGMVAAKAAIATAGHNIANATTEGYSRQRVQTEDVAPDRPSVGNNIFGDGTRISRVERVNDEYIEKQIRNGTREMAGYEERDVVLRQTEDIFNEMNGDGLNRLVSQFFNGFRRLANEPDSEAVRQSVREASQAVVNDFHRLHDEVESVRQHIDARLQGNCTEINSIAERVCDLNQRIKQAEIQGTQPNDLLDQRDAALRKLSTYADLSIHSEKDGTLNVDIRGVGALISGPSYETFSVETSPADSQGKTDGSFDLKTTASAGGRVTHQLKGGKFGALLEVRDKMLSTIQSRLDDLAHTMITAVNELHEQGFNREGVQGISFFKPLADKDRAAEFIDLSDDVKNSVNNIATAAIADAPGDNRIAVAVSGLQDAKLMSNGQTTMDAWYNSIVSDVGVASSKNKFNLTQQKDINTQLNKMRDQTSGVSIDEETANLMQFEHMFGASAKVIQVADELLKTVLDLKR